MPPLHAVMASAAGAANTSRRCRSAMAAHETGVPAATWSAPELLTLGSGPGCRPEARSTGVAVQIDLAGAAGFRDNQDLMRVVRAAVQGRSVRNRSAAGSLMGEVRSIDGLVASAAEAEPDLDGEAAFFEMSSASAEQVTLQIRSMLERAREYIAIAHQGRAHMTLEYASWDEYVDDRLGDLRLTVSREQRGAVVQSLSRAQMSQLAIAKVLGVSVATAYRDAAAGAAEPDQDEQTDPSHCAGRDGRQYRKRRRTTLACTICGEVHEEPPDKCPWDLFAQGRGPRPGRTAQQSGADTYMPDPSDGREEETSGNAAAGTTSPDTVVDSVTRAVCIVDELELLPELVGEIEIAVESNDVIRSVTGLRRVFVN